MALTPKQRLFVKEYLVDLNATQAVIRAGYCAKNADVTGPRMLGNVGIREAIEKAKAEREEELKVDAKWVLQKLIQNVERAAQAEPVLDREGNNTGEYRYDGAVVNKGLELIGKHVGMFVERKEVSGPGGKPIEHEHTGSVVLTGRIEELANAFEGAADREKEGDLSGDSP